MVNNPAGNAAGSAVTSPGMSRTRIAVIGAVAFGMLAGAAWWDASIQRHDAAVVAAASPIVIPDAGAWWAATARCLGDRDTVLPSGVRFYYGDVIPANWLGAEDVGRTFHGYTDPSTRRVLLMRGHADDRALVTHELWHVVHGLGHPARIFPDGGLPGLCGMARK